MKKKIKTSTIIFIVFIALCFAHMFVVNIIITKEILEKERIDESQQERHKSIEFYK